MAASTLTKADFDQLMHLIRPLATRIANGAGRATVQLVDDTGKTQMLQIGVLEGETGPDAEHFQPYGFSSVPLVGAQGVVLFPNGDQSHPLVIVMGDNRSRPTGGAPGDVVMYHHTGAKITMTGAGDIVADPAPGRTFSLAGAAAAQQALLGNAFLSALGTLVTTIGTAVGGIVGAPSGPIGAAAGTSIASALTSFMSASTAYLSQIVKLS
ncbi:MAG: phage baseplate assembly protein V [Actinomycetota bacterium]